MSTRGQNQTPGPSRPEDARSPASATILRIPVTGLAIVLSLLIGFVFGMLNYSLSGRRGKAQPARRAPVAAPAAMNPPPAHQQPISLQHGASGRLEVRKVDFQLVENQPRVTIALNQRVPHDVHRLDQPDRIYIDLHGAHLAAELAPETTVVVNKDGISRIRLAQTKADTVRVVLDLEKRFDYSVKAGSDGTALVVKLRPHAGVAAKRRADASPQ